MVRGLLYRGFLNEGEEILMSLHRHILLDAGRFLKLAILGIGLPAALFYFFRDAWIFALVWGWLGLMRIVYVWLDWYYDAWLVTNVSIVHIEWDGFFRKAANRSEYHLIESIGYEVNGFWATLLNFGTIVIEKETGNKLVFDGVAFPRARTDQMLKYQDHFVSKRNLRTHKTLKNLLTDLLHYATKHEGKF